MGNLWDAGWWLISTPLKNMKVNWDDDIPYGKMFQTTNQITICKNPPCLSMFHGI